MTNEKSTAIIQLPKGRKFMVSFGSIMLSVAVACYGLALMTLVPPILQRLDGMSFAGLVGLCISLGITLLSPIGGKLGDIFGRKAIVVVAGLINLICGVGIAFASNVLVLLICCFGVTADTVQKGVNGVFLTAGLVTLVGVVLCLTKIRPMLENDSKA